jgi:hypothetical protein
MLIFARCGNRPSAEWIDSIQAPWLLPEQGAEKLVLPDTVQVPYAHWELNAADMEPSKHPASEMVHWFPERAVSPARVPLLVSPSNAEPVPVKVLDQLQLGSRIVLTNGVEMNRVGSAIHACIAAAMGNVGQEMSTDEIAQVLAALQLEKSIQADQVLSQIEALGRWIEGRWPGSKRLCEVPVSVRLDNGQVAKGQIDLLLETQDGYVLIDHKANPKGRDEWEQVARRYGGQLALHKQAVETATSTLVKELWLYFPVSGGAVSIEVQPANSNEVSNVDHATIAASV